MELVTPTASRVSLTDWQTDYAPLTHLRTQVFVVEQGVPPEMEIDSVDAHCVHALARDATGKPVGCGRLIIEPAQRARVGRMAVLAAARGAGVGGQVLAALVAAAQAAGVTTVYLHAQTHAVPFYLRHGFIAHGPEFLDCGIAHFDMERPL